MLPASLVALIPPGKFSAIGTYAFHEPVRKEALIMGAVSQPDDLRVNVIILDKGFDDAISPCMVCGRVRITKEAEIHFHFLENVLKMVMVLIDKLLWRNAKFLSVHHYWSAVCIRATNKRCLLPLFPESPDKDIGRDVGSQVTYVAFSVCIGKTAGDKDWFF